MNKIHTRESIKESTKILLWENGINKTSVIDICNAANISRMSFYREFENKNEIVNEIISEFYKEAIDLQISILNKPIPFLERINELIYTKIEFIKGMKRELLKEILHQKNPELKLLLDKQRQIGLDYLLYQIKLEQKKGNFRKELNLEFIMYYINKITEFMFDPELIRIYPDTSELIREINKVFYFGILERN